MVGRWGSIRLGMPRFMLLTCGMWGPQEFFAGDFSPLRSLEMRSLLGKQEAQLTGEPQIIQVYWSFFSEENPGWKGLSQFLGTPIFSGIWTKKNVGLFDEAWGFVQDQSVAWAAWTNGFPESIRLLLLLLLLLLWWLWWLLLDQQKLEFESKNSLVLWGSGFWPYHRRITWW